MVYEDRNHNNHQDAGEPGIAGLVVGLDPALALDAVARPASQRETITDADGRYRFADVLPGNYQITVSDPQHHWPTIKINVTVVAGMTSEPPPVGYKRLYLPMTLK